MAIVKQYHKDTDTTYVYESESYWDAEKGQSRSKRRVIGKIDPQTGEVVPTGKRGRSKKEPSSDDLSGKRAGTCDNSEYQNRILELELVNSTLKTRVSELEAELERYRSALSRISSLSSKISATCITTDSSR